MSMTPYFPMPEVPLKETQREAVPFVSLRVGVLTALG